MNAKTTTVPDEEVLEQVRLGQTEVYAVLAGRYSKRLFSLTQGILRNRADAEDALQQAHLRALEHARDFAGRSAFFTWLTRIAINESLAQVRRRRRQSAEPLDEEEAPRVWFVCSGRSPEQAASDKELARALSSAVEALPETHRSVFRLRAIEEISTEETARRLGISTECVKSRLFRARYFLRNRLRGHLGPAPVQSRRARAA